MNDNYNFKGEVVKEYEFVESAIKDLNEYIKNDEIYTKYIEKTKENFDDFEIFCINHVKSIKKLLEEYKYIKEEMERIVK